MNLGDGRFHQLERITGGAIRGRGERRMNQGETGK